MPIFDEFDRNHVGPANSVQTQFWYLNHSNRPEAGRVRETLEQWFDRYPESHRSTLLNRLRSPVDEEHLSAFFELLLHEFLLRSDHRIVAIEPTLEHTDRSPDFEVEGPCGGRFYLEAVLATGKSHEERSAQRRLNEAVHEVESADAPMHFLELRIAGKPTQQVSLRLLRRQLRDWIALLPAEPDAVDPEPFVFCEHEMELTVTAYLRNRPRTSSGSAIGVQWMEPCWRHPGDGIRESVGRKANRYGRLNAPYVVAVNMLDNYSGTDDLLDALFGSPCVIIRTYDDGRIEDRPSRNQDGVWWGPQGIQHRGLSAVLGFPRLTPWSLAQRTAHLVRNPWAINPLPEVLLNTAEINPTPEGRFSRVHGAPLSNHFQLDANWPEI